MITKIRQIIAYYVSIFLIIISFGLLKPNYCEEPIEATPAFKNKSEISIEVDENFNKKNS